jgi:heme O synthase-like polyprenyltransferase
MVMAFLVVASTINIVRLVAVIVAGTLASGGAGALNCYLDRDLDRTMGQTSRRPMPKGEVSPARALVFGLVQLGEELSYLRFYYRYSQVSLSLLVPLSTYSSTPNI